MKVGGRGTATWEAKNRRTSVKAAIHRRAGSAWEDFFFLAEKEVDAAEAQRLSRIGFGRRSGGARAGKRSRGHRMMSGDGAQRVGGAGGTREQIIEL